MFTASVIIAVYNRIKFLEYVLEGFKRQIRMDFEVIIADDCSSDPVREFISEFGKSSPFTVKYVCNDRDEFFGKVRIVNQAIAKSESDYIIFCDGDCVPHREFVNMHLLEREKGYYLSGRAGFLSAKITSLVDRNFVSSGKLEKFNIAILHDTLFGKTHRYFDHCTFIRNNSLMNLVRKTKGTNILIGRNFSAWKDDLIKVNGYDEDFVGTGHEDFDLMYRFLNLGIKSKVVTNRAICYHLWHELVVPPAQPEKHERSHGTGRIRSDKGIDQYLH